MNTCKGLAKVTARSPSLLLSVGAVATTTAAGVALALLSEVLVDDMAILLLLGLLGLVSYFQFDWALALVERLWPMVVWRIPTRQPRAALTIDDVPLLANPTTLEEILDVLREHQVTATFFVMSGFSLEAAEGGMEPKARERCMALLRRAVKEGHELANHLQFDFPAIAMSPEEFDRAFLHCDALLAELAGGEAAWRGRPKRWFRPASALWNRHILATARRKSYTTVIGNCYPHDVAAVTRHVNPTYLGQRVRPGSVIVVHDRWHTAATLAKALPLIAKKGMKLGTLSELQAAADGEEAQRSDRKER